MFIKFSSDCTTVIDGTSYSDMTIGCFLCFVLLVHFCVTKQSGSEEVEQKTPGFTDLKKSRTILSPGPICDFIKYYKVPCQGKNVLMKY